MPRYTDHGTHNTADALSRPMRVARTAHVAAWVMISVGSMLQTGEAYAEMRNRPAMEQTTSVHRQDFGRQKSVALVIARPLNDEGEQTALRRVAGNILRARVGAWSIASLAAASLLLLAAFAFRRRRLTWTALHRARSPRTVYRVKT